MTGTPPVDGPSVDPDILYKRFEDVQQEMARAHENFNKLMGDLQRQMEALYKYHQGQG